MKTPESFDWEEARISAGFTRGEFEALPGDPMWISKDDPVKMSKADVIMSHHYRRLLSIVQEVEAYKKK